MGAKEKKAELAERKQNRIDAGLMSAHYPNVSSIVIYMDYYHKTAGPSFMHRTVNFHPGSAAYFHMECMRHDCIDGGFDFGNVIRTMIRGRLQSGNGELVCNGNNTSGHTRVDYKITIQYNEPNPAYSATDN